MDNVIWIILAAAVFIALAGFMLFIGSDVLTDVSDEATGFMEDTEDDPSQYSSMSFEPQPTIDPQNSQLNTDSINPVAAS